MTNRTAANDAELTSAISASSGGDTIELTGSVYGALDIQGTSFASEVVIFGSDSNNKPSFQYQNAITRLDNTNNVTFRDVVFQRDWDSVNDSGDQSNTIRIDAATNLLIEDCEIKGGTLANGNPIGRGVNDQGSASDVIFRRVKFHNLFKGYTGNTNQLTFDDCEFTALRSDGMSLGAQTDILISKCHFHDFDTVPGSTAHPDMIQIYRNNSIGTANLTVRDCVFDVGLGRYGQGLFAGQSGATNGSPGSAVRHSNWLIENNIFHIDHTNMCTVNWVDGITIRRNSMFIAEASNSASESGIDVDSTSTNATIQENIVGTVPTAQAGWTVSNNTLVLEANYGTQVNFIASTDRTNPGQGFSDSYHDYEIKTGGSAHTNLHGARISKRQGDWGGNGRTPPTSYLGGFGSAAPSLPVLPSGSVSATVTVP